MFLNFFFGKYGRRRKMTLLGWETIALKVRLGILYITSPKRCPQIWPWSGRSLSQQILLNLIKRCSNQLAEMFMNATIMRVFTNRKKRLIIDQILRKRFFSKIVPVFRKYLSVSPWNLPRYFSVSF